MVKIAFNPSTLKAIYNPVTKKLRTSSCCPSYEFQYAPCDNRCFLDPEPDSWISEKTYALYECVAYGSYLYYSTTDNNAGHTPGADGFWAVYLACGNQNWNSFPPFGGIGKTPLKYAVSVSFTVTTEGESAPEINRKYYIALNKCCVSGPFSFCVHDYYAYADEQDGGSLIGLNLSCSETEIKVTPYPYGINFIHCETGGCTIKGNCSNSGNWSGGSLTKAWTINVSWRPLDCDYTSWSELVDYNVNDCVAWHGKFYKACRRSGPNYGGYQEPPIDADDVCSGGDYWRLV